MPFYDYKCKCGATVELRTPPSARWRKHAGCGHRMERQYPTEFSALNTTSPNGERFKGCEMGLGVRPTSVGEQDQLMKETGTRPWEEYRYHKGGLDRKEITEKELGEVLSEVSNVGSV